MAMHAEIRLPEWLTGWRLPPAPASDADCLRLSIALARENVARSLGPFGAVVRADASGEVVAVGVNLALPTGNPVLHAETVALSLAGRRLAAPGGVTLFCSCEPCIMCLGAAHWAEVHRIVWSASKEDAEAAGFSEGAGTEQLKAQMAARGVVLEGGVLQTEGSQVLHDYIRNGGVIYGPPA
ncbi:MAG TPA: nucleoside deaminase [Hyphomonadaceae bacterium]|nr:nucleoside deaminase [Hyphomonadaceae bacterium]